MNSPTTVREFVWDAMLSADLSQRYYARLTVRFQSQDRWAKLLIAVTSSTTVSGWAIWSKAGLDWLWHGASAVTAIVGLALPVVDPTRSMKTANKLSAAWYAILKDYELLWSQVDTLPEVGARAEWEKLLEKEELLAESAATLGFDTHLAGQSEQEVRRSRGLEGS
jgi:hypothetical protein